MNRIRNILLRPFVLLVICSLLGWQFLSHTGSPLPFDSEGTDPDPPPDEGHDYKDPPSTSTSAVTIPTVSEPQPTQASQRPKEVDPTHFSNATKIIHAITHPDDSTFPRLQCPPPTDDRYKYLKVKSSNPRITKPKYFFALDLYQCASLLPRLLGSVMEAIQFLGPENCALSIVEGRSTDGTFEVVKLLQTEIEARGAQYFYNTSDVDPLAGGTNRIQALADLRNMALEPLMAHPQDYDPASVVIFINDVALCMEDILELIHQRVYQKADMTCAMDWLDGGAFFYDVWVSRSMTGDQFFEVPQDGTWKFAANLFWNDQQARTSVKEKRPFQVFACWNGATVFTAKPLMQQKIHFRSNYENECYLGEPTLLCKDLWYEGYGRIAVVPSVNVGYDSENSSLIKGAHGSTSENVEKESATDGVSPLIEWEEQPPCHIKCVPSYQDPSWVPWDQAQEERKIAASRTFGEI